MTQQKPRLKYTVSDYMSMPDNGKRYELLDGEMISAPSATPRHQTVQKRIVLDFVRIFEGRNLGQIFIPPLDVVFSDGDVAQPDVMFISNERLDIITDANIQGAPDLVVEVLSPSTAIYDRGYKLILYGRHGVKEYWLVDPFTASVLVYVQGREGLVEYARLGPDGQMTTPLTQEMSIDLAGLFRLD